ncbi:hypothetical protein BH23VER1_BH23VER1_09960 [soil metagenome]
MKSASLFIIAGSILSLALSPLRAEVFNLRASMDGEQANAGAGTGSAATGTASVTYDDDTMTLAWTISWSGLTGTETMMHFHGPAPAGTNAGIQVPLGTTSPETGSTTISASQADDLLAGLWYVNLHTTTNTGGEIRGQLLPAAPIVQYWPLDETAGTTAPNLNAQGTDAELFNGVTWVTDAERGQVLEFDGIDGYATAGMFLELLPETSVAWSFWANSAQGSNNNVIVGNRFPDEGWIKFTTNAFEYRNIDGSINETIDHPPFATDVWIHHAAAKRGNLLTYYRNGLAMGNQWVTDILPGPPLYFGGDTTNENWAGRLDDVATWIDTDILPECVVDLASGNATPADDCLELPRPPIVFSDDFSAGLDQWTVTDRGLENNAFVGYDAPDTTGGQLTLGGITNDQFWFGSSLESNESFEADEYSIVEVDRVSLTGTGTAYRSSVWIYGDDGHFLHLAQNVGENGWQYNANDVGGIGTLGPAGSGNNLEGLDALDNDGGSA